MHLAIQGHPLHSRALSISVAQREDGKLDAYGYLLDLRKRGFVPVAGDLQSSGIIHHMQLTGVVDPVTNTLETIVAVQPAVAFEPSAASAGESCRDPIGRIAALAGTKLDADYARHIRTEIGGPRGCSHIVTLAQLLGSTVPWALDWDRETNGHDPRRATGERIFRRDLILDGHEASDGRLQIGIQLIDLLFAPAPALARPMERFAGQFELRALATVDVTLLELVAVEAAERRRSAANLKETQWRDRTDAVAPLVGLRLISGVGAELLRRIGDRPDDRPLLDASLMLAPAVMQCAGALSEQWPLEAILNPSLMGTGGLPDSCYMWRRDGALHRALKCEIKSGTLRLRRG